ncbi:MAG: T9SS type A sorting domain-containing protein [Melioribacteraceae bacterium]|nr:T9SS type A sorting domain-containing protein [Melioribacteraceae bacterium]
MYKLNGDTHYSFPFDVFPGVSRSANAIAINNDSIWVGSGDFFNPGGLTLICQDNYYFYTSQNSDLPIDYVSSILLVNDDIWIGTSIGLVRIDKNNIWTVYNENNTPMPEADITCLYFKNGILWVGTYYGVTRYSYATDQWEYIEDIEEVDVTALLCDENENLWIGTGFYGLGYYNGDSLQNYHIENSGLIDNRITGLTYNDKKDLWVSTLGGISVFDQSSDTWENLTILNSGLASSMINCLAYNPTTEKMIIGSYANMGLSVYDPFSASIDNNRKEKNNYVFDLYPNPAQDYVNIETLEPLSNEYSWSIFNINGREIIKGESSNALTKINISNIPDGLYMIKIKCRESMQTKKIIKLNR